MQIEDFINWPNAGGAMKLMHKHCGAINIHGSPDEFLLPFAQVPRPIGHIFAVFWCNAEVNNGGLHQFFSNSTGILAPEAVEGFKALGLSERGSLITQAVALFGEEYRLYRARVAMLLPSIF